MSARAPASRPLRALALALAAALHLANGNGTSCARDGLYADYESECRQYVRCARGAAARYACALGRAFSEPAGACVPEAAQPCVRRTCAPGDTRAYAAPGTTCRHYYRCRDGAADELACPSGAWFDHARQACTRGAGTCYEPLCAGLPDGEYPDSSHECRRTLLCRGGELRAVASCDGACASDCPAPRTAAVPLPAGDADFCSDEACSSLCQHAADGAYPDRSSSCREYFVCEARRVTRRGVCEPGLIFSGGGCVSRARGHCAPPARSPCFNRADGPHRDWRACGAWFECRRERVVARGACPPGLAFDGAACVPAATFPCAGPERNAECEGLPSGTYQDLESNCTRYFHCEGALRTTLACASGQVFDGARCSPSARHLCPSLARDSCHARADGRYPAPDSCRGYYACAAGEKALYACAAGQAFDGEACAPAGRVACARDDGACAALPDGYHAEIDTGCHRYFYCEGGDRLATLACLGGKVFDGRACAAPALHACGAPAAPRPPAGRECERDGFYVQPGTGCRSYYFCVTGARTRLTCPEEQLFNGQVCVPSAQYACPG